MLSLRLGGFPLESLLCVCVSLVLVDAELDSIVASPTLSRGKARLLNIGSFSYFLSLFEFTSVISAEGGCGKLQAESNYCFCLYIDPVAILLKAICLKF